MRPGLGSSWCFGNGSRTRRLVVGLFVLEFQSAECFCSAVLRIQRLFSFSYSTLRPDKTPGMSEPIITV
jgi:hypothetical protein